MKRNVRQFWISIGSVAVATLLQFAFWQFLQPSPYQIYYAAVIFACYYGRGAFSIWLSALLGQYFFVEPYFRLTFENPRDVAQPAIFVMTSFLIRALVDGHRRTARRSLITEASHKKTKDELEVILDRVTDGITVINAKGELVFANRQGAHMCGFSTVEDFLTTPSAEIMGKYELLSEEGQLLSEENMPGRQALLGVKKPKEALVCFCNRDDGKKRWAIVSAAPIFDARGRVTHAVSIFRDFTERRQYEETLKEREEKFRTLSEASKILSSSLDYETTLASVARLAVPGFSDWCAVDVLDENGILKRLAVSHSDPEKVKIAFEIDRHFPTAPDSDFGTARVLRSGVSVLVEEITPELLAEKVVDPAKRALLEQLQIRSYIGVPLAFKGQPVGVLTFVQAESGRRYGTRDLEVAEELGRRASAAVENSKLFMQAQEAIRARDEFLSIASHELKTPLTSLKLQTELRQRALAKSEMPFSHDRLSEMNEGDAKQIRRLSLLIEDMLDISRISSGKLHIQKEEFELGALVGEVLERLNPMFHATGVRVTVDHPHSVEGEWDRFRLEQVVVNLLTNALRYGRGRPVGVQLERQGDYAVLTVKDQGVGIAPADQGRIFERFERAVSASEVSGLGLGLYIVRQIIEMHGGTVRVESKVDQGSSFRVEIPLRIPQERILHSNGHETLQT